VIRSRREGSTAAPPPSAPPARSSFVRAPPARRLLALALAAGLGLWWNVRMLRGKVERAHAWELLAQDLEPLVPAAPPGSVVGILVQGGPAAEGTDAEMVGVAQYAFTPVRVRGVPWQECATSGPAACGLTGVDHLIVGTRSPEELAAWGSQFGLAFAGTSGRYALLSRSGTRR
jgi:hypothetical protein